MSELKGFLTYPELAERLGMNVNAVHQLIFRHREWAPVVLHNGRALFDPDRVAKIEAYRNAAPADYRLSDLLLKLAQYGVSDAQDLTWVQQRYGYLYPSGYVPTGNVGGRERTWSQAVVDEFIAWHEAGRPPRSELVTEPPGREWRHRAG